MRETFKVGLSTSRRIEVDPGRTIDFMGEDCRVYATPELVRDIEMTCRDLIKSHADPGQDSVGTHIGLDHVAATLLGMWVEISVSVESFDGRGVGFRIECRDPLEVCATGVHRRFIVDIDKTAQRLRAKASKAAQ